MIIMDATIHATRRPLLAEARASSRQISAARAFLSSPEGDALAGRRVAEAAICVRS
jgi:hypothetical protein